MKIKFLLFFICAAFSLIVAAQNVGIGTTTPVNKLEVNGAIRADSDLYVLGNTGIGLTAPNYKLDVAGIINTSSNAYVAGFLGVGTTAPVYKLDVAGIIHSTSNNYVGGYLGVGTTSPIYKIQVDDGSVAIHSTADSKYWYMNYSSSGNYFNIAEDGSTRVAIANGGNVGIGTTAPTAKLNVVGTTALNGTVTVTGTENVSGTLTVNSNKGVIYNAAASTNLRYYTRTAAFTIVNLAPHTLTAEASIGFSGFTLAPQVFVGNITSNGGTTGPLYQLQLVIYDVTATSCHCRILNTSDATINQGITWNIMCMGN